jgi:hypothetical protein
MADKDRYEITEAQYKVAYTQWAENLTHTLRQANWVDLRPPVNFQSFIPREDLDNIGKSFNEYFMLLARAGWYPHGSMSVGLVRDLVSEIKKGNYVGADEKMAFFLEKAYENMKKEVLTNIPNRHDVLEKAFQAHESGEYILSVPIFLIQSDGICFDMIKEQLYVKKGDRRKIAVIVDKIDVGVVTKALLSPLAEIIPLTADANERRGPNYPRGALNRHQVLHGESVDYGTKTNSFKSISLLNYVFNIRRFIHEDNTA